MVWEVVDDLVWLQAYCVLRLVYAVHSLHTGPVDVPCFLQTPVISESLVYDNVVHRGLHLLTMCIS